MLSSIRHSVYDWWPGSTKSTQCMCTVSINNQSTFCANVHSSVVSVKLVKLVNVPHHIDFGAFWLAVIVKIHQFYWIITSHCCDWLLMMSFSSYVIGRSVWPIRFPCQGGLKKSQGIVTEISLGNKCYCSHCVRGTM